MESFIEAVQQYPCLWDTNDKEYRNGDYKNRVWRKIVDLLHMREISDVRTAKAEWKKLRDNHRDSLKRQKATATATNNWRYATLMDFLVPYMKNRVRSTNFSDFGTQDIEENPLQGFANEFHSQETATDNDESITTIAFANANESTKRSTRKRSSDTDIIDIFKEMEERYARRSQKHPLELFFESMAQTAMKMPVYLQTQIKKKVLGVVCEAEEIYEGNSESKKSVSNYL